MELLDVGVKLTAVMPNRHQSGYVFRKGGWWYVRFYDNVAEPDGRIIRRQVCRQIAPYGDGYRSKNDVKPLVLEMLNPVNSNGCLPESVLTVEQFIQNHYLPHVTQQKRASTAKGYKDIWEFHVKGKFASVRLRDFRTVDGERFLQAVAKQHDYKLSRTTLKHIKSFLSGVFTFARRQGVLTGANPMQGVSIPHGREPESTYAYSLEEITSMLAVLTGAARVLVGTAAFTGLRRSEIRGLRWEDYQPTADGQLGEIRVERSVWRRHVQPTKTQRSRASVPVIPALEKILDGFRAERGNPQSGFIFEGTRNRQPLDLDTFAKRYIEPFLSAKNQRWRWWHPFRRGLATNLHRLGVDDRSIQTLLRHSSVNTTREIYIKGVDGDAVAAMDRLEAAIQPVRPN
jgi:integrase